MRRSILTLFCQRDPGAIFRAVRTVIIYPLDCEISTEPIFKRPFDEGSRIIQPFITDCYAPTSVSRICGAIRIVTSSLHISESLHKVLLISFRFIFLPK